MEDLLLGVLLGYGGFLGAQLLISRIGYWISAILQAIASGRGSPGRTTLGVTAVLLLHSTPWLLIMAAMVVRLIILSANSYYSEAWFFGGALVALIFDAAFAFRFLRLWRARRSAGTS